MKRGWCPTLHAPMPTGDGLLVRVKPPSARLTPAQARSLAGAAQRDGNGILELTQRGNIQLRGLAPATTARFAATMADSGLAHPDPALEARRAVIPPPLLGDDPTLAPEAAQVTAALEEACLTDPRLATLPPKFAIAIDAGGILGGRPLSATIRVRVDADGAHLRPPSRGTSPAPVGLLPYDDEYAAFGLAPPFAQLDAPILRHLAQLAERFATTLRITPFRAILLGRIRRADAPSIIAATNPALIIDPADPRLLVTACIGAPGCTSATTPTRSDATRIAARLHPAAPVHVSGCPKGCACPNPTAVTYVARNGRYDLIRDGRASDPPTRTALTLATILA